MSSNKGQLLRGDIILQTSIIFLSTTGVLGRYIDLDPNWIIWLRAGIGCLMLLAFCLIIKSGIRIRSKRTFGIILLSAILMAGHWLTYFQALALEEVAIVMLALFAYPTITAVLEPIINKDPMRWQTILLAVLVTIGLSIMSYGNELSPTGRWAILLGLISALCYALRNIVLKKINQEVDSVVIMLYQTGLVAIMLLPMLGYIETRLPTSQIIPILILCLVPTVLGHTLFVNSMKYMSVSKASIISALTPIYGAAWAFFILKEVPSIYTVIGGVVILFSVVLAVRMKEH